MARLRVLSAEELADPDLQMMMKAPGDEMFGVYGHCPDLWKSYLNFYRPAKYGGRLPFAPKELVRLKKGLTPIFRSFYICEGVLVNRPFLASPVLGPQYLLIHLPIWCCG